MFPEQIEEADKLPLPVAPFAVGEHGAWDDIESAEQVVALRTKVWAALPPKVVHRRQQFGGFKTWIWDFRATGWCIIRRLQVPAWSY